MLSLFQSYDGRTLTLQAAIKVMVAAGRAAVDIILICAIAGMIIGLVGRTGLSFGLGLFLVQLGQSSLLLLLILTALVCIVMGMGLPTVGVYLLLASLAAPPLVELGLQPMAAHLFVLYFGMLSMLTPPVAIAAFVAANLAQAAPMRTAVEAVRIAWPAYLIPFLFAVSPALIFVGSLPVIIVTAAKALIGVYAISVAIVGFLNRDLLTPERLLLGVGGLAVLYPPDALGAGLWLNLGGGAVLASLTLMRFRRRA